VGGAMVGPTLSNSTDYSNYLILRRELGEAENGDISEYEWKNKWPFDQKVILHDMLKKCDELMKDRDLSWKNYCKSASKPHTYKSITEWHDVPLFIKAAIIKPNNEVNGFYDFNTGTYYITEPVNNDIPDTEITPW
jgi:hypothetical protein